MCTGFRPKCYLQKRNADCSAINLHIISSVHGKFHFSLILLINLEAFCLLTCHSALRDPWWSWTLSEIFKNGLYTHAGFHICNGSTRVLVYLEGLFSLLVLSFMST
jgi:hypothetical protein